MRYTPRRRRGDEEQHEGGGLPVIPLVIIVIFAGLLLGGLLAHFFGSRESGAQQAMSPSLLTPVPSPTLIPSPTPFRRAHHVAVARLSPTPSATPTATPRASTPKPTAKPAPGPSATPAPTPLVTPRMVPVVTQAPHTEPQPTQAPRPQPTQAPATPLPAVITASPRPPPAAAPSERPVERAAVRVASRPRGMDTDDPAEVVRAYLYALEHGNASQAASYLAFGDPAEPFMRGAHVADIESSNNGDGTYLVTADVRARTGEYRVTFTVAALPQGMVITDHFYIKPH